MGHKTAGSENDKNLLDESVFVQHSMMKMVDVCKRNFRDFFKNVNITDQSSRL